MFLLLAVDLSSQVCSLKSFLNCINNATSSPHHRQSFGSAVKGVQIAKSVWTKAKESDQEPYQTLLNYRNTPRGDILGLLVQRVFEGRTKTVE